MQPPLTGVAFAVSKSTPAAGEHFEYSRPVDGHAPALDQSLQKRKPVYASVKRTCTLSQ